MPVTTTREPSRDHVHLNVQISRAQADFLQQRADENYASVSAEARRLITAAMRAETDRMAA